MKYPNGHFKPKPCRNCGEAFQPEAPSHLYCGDECKEAGRAGAYYKRTYNIDFHSVASMRSDQDHACAICGSEGFLMDEGRHRAKLAVDHCHTTGKIRGLLCHNCNRALGLLQDSPELLRKAADYVEAHGERATTSLERRRAEADAARSARPSGVPEVMI